MTITPLQQKLEVLYGLRLHSAQNHRNIRPGYYELLARLGNPHLSIPPAIHVAGTNGKGSTIAFLRAMYEAGGYKAHVYTSPHLVRFNERIVLTGSEIDDKNLEMLIDEVMDKADTLEVTFFEVATAIAFLAFSRTPADLCLIEVGMGGRIDCTNVIPKPLATIITRISYDHCQYLGNTIQEIAKEKAGIIKPGVPCIIGYQETKPSHDSETLPFDSIAGQHGAPLHRAGQEWRISNPESEPSQFIFRYGSLEKTFPVPSLVGMHQLQNAGAALACTYVIDSLPIHDESRAKGLTRAIWPARLQRFDKHPLQRLIPANAELWLDGGHNDSAGQVLAQQAMTWHAQDARPLHVVMAMKRDKDAVQFIGPLLPHLSSLTIIPLAGHEEQSHDPAELSHRIQAMEPQLRVSAAESIQEALEEIAIRISSPPAPEVPGVRVLLTGSLFLAGSVLAQ